MRDGRHDRPIGHSNSCVRNQTKLVPWIWEGVVAEGAVTLLSAAEKVGKTTLLSLLLDRRRSGGQLLGRAVYPGKTILCSEENEHLWALRQPPLDFGPQLILHRPSYEYPTRGSWRRFIGDVFSLQHQPDPFDLLVIDTAVRFMPLAYRNPRVPRWSLGQLTIVADLPAAVLVLNQSPNVHRPLAAFADIVIEMEIPRGQGTTRRRTFTGVGRYPETLQSARAELNHECTDYLLLPDSPAPSPPLLGIVQTLLAASPTPLTGRELLARWPGAAPCPNRLWRTLSRGVERGLCTVSGTGTKTDAFRYGLVRQAKAKESAGGDQPGADTG